MSEQAGLSLEWLRAATVWRDGQVLRGVDAQVSVWDHGLLYGDGIFEGIRLRAGRVYRLQDHLDRLRRSAAILQLDVPRPNAELRSAIAAVCFSNGLADAHIRIVVTRGVGLPGIDPRRSPATTTLVLAYPFPPVLGEAPISLITSSVARKSPRSIDAQVKSLNYLDAVLAKLQANAAGAEDALMLDGGGHLAEATGANVFVVTGGVVRTPDTTAALAGITRRTILELAAAHGYRPEVTQLTVGAAYVADEVFLTGTGAGIVPVGRIDGRVVPLAPGPVTQQLRMLYQDTWALPAYSETLKTLGSHEPA